MRLHPARPLRAPLSISAMLFALPVACGGSPTPGGAGEADTGPFVSTDGESSGTAPITDGSSSGDDPTEDSAVGPGTADESGDVETGALPADGWAIAVVPSSSAVTESDEGGTLTIECHVTYDGAPVQDAAPAIGIFPNEGVNVAGGVYTFESFGVYEARCELVLEDGMLIEATAPVAVLNEIIDPTMARLGEGLGGGADAIYDVIAASGQSDEALVQAVERLSTIAPELGADHFEGLEDVVRVVPFDYYPSSSDLEAMGIAESADDAMLLGALDQLDVALADLQSTVAAFDPAAPTDADAAALAEHSAAIESAVGELIALEPTAHGLLATRTRVAQLVRERVAPTTAAVTSWADARVRAEADVLFTVVAGSDPQHFGLLGLTLGMFGDSYLQVRLLKEWYGDYIAQLDESFNNLILADAIDYYIEQGDEPPTIDFLIASASIGFATPGYPSWVDGFNFDEDPERNLFLVFGDSWQGIIDNIISGCGIELTDTLPERVDTLVTCFEEIGEAVDSIFLVPLSVGPGQYGSEQGLDLGEFPEVCGGGLPTATFLLPINYENGRGPNYFVNCI